MFIPTFDIQLLRMLKCQLLTSFTMVPNISKLHCQLSTGLPLIPKHPPDISKV